jgi:hypothetical protein
VIFVKREGDDILFSTIRGRRKTTNMVRDPRVSLLVHSVPIQDETSAYATIAGTVELTDDPAGAFHQVMYDLYMGGATPPAEPGAQRVIFGSDRRRSTSRRRTRAPPSSSRHVLGELRLVHQR